MFELFVSWRYLQGRGNSLLSGNAKLALFPPFIGTTLLVIVLSIFNGFQKQVKNSIFKFEPHIIVEYTRGNGQLPQWRKWKQKIMTDMPDKVLAKVSSVEGMIQSPAIFRAGSEIDYIILRGQEFALQKENGKNVRILPQDFPQITEPYQLKTLPMGKQCLIGREMSLLQNLKVGDTFEVVVPRGKFRLQAGAEASISRCRVAGLFKTGHYQYDSRAVIMPLDTAQSIYGFGDEVQQIVLRLKNISDLRAVKRALYKIFPASYYIRTVEDEQRNFFAALQLEKTIMTVIVFLLIVSSLAFIIVAMFNVIRSRQKDIGILKSLGVSSRSIMTMFTVNGFMMGAIGTILGVLLGLYLAFELETILNGLEAFINFAGQLYTESIPEWINSIMGRDVFMPDIWIRVSLIPKDVYYFDKLPVAVDLAGIHTLSFLTILLTGVAALIPARYASRLEVMEIIRGAEG